MDDIESFGFRSARPEEQIPLFFQESESSIDEKVVFDKIPPAVSSVSRVLFLPDRLDEYVSEVVLFCSSMLYSFTESE